MNSVDTTLNLEGELQERGLFELGELLVRLSLRGSRRVVVDFSEVSHLDYRGVKPLLRKVERFRDAGGDVKLAGLSPYLKAILRAAGAHAALEVYASIPEAWASFEREPVFFGQSADLSTGL